ncbi:hypothetical protein HMPREF3121_06490 [Corynebacterium sp. HMSC11E11]|nr:hypothetical protein HMPREF3121_06490 [Corynebacterium sp. HMSC11E11]
MGDLLEPVPAEEAMPVDYSRRRIRVGRRTVVAVAMAGAVVLVAVIAGWLLSRGPVVDEPAVDAVLVDADRVGAAAGGAGAGVENAGEWDGARPGGAGHGGTGSGGAGDGAVPAEIIVSVVGMVHHPGVVTVPGTARVADAVNAAGGMLPEASPASVNLASPLVDGQQILVGPDPLPALSTGGTSAGAPDGAASAAGGVGGGEAGAGGGAGGGGGGGGLVNINTASEAELETVTGIGPATAKKIVAHREQHGPFTSVDQLEEVPGIGPAKLEGMRAEVTV